MGQPVPAALPDAEQHRVGRGLLGEPAEVREGFQSGEVGVGQLRGGKVGVIFRGGEEQECLERPVGRAGAVVMLGHDEIGIAVTDGEEPGVIENRQG